MNNNRNQNRNEQDSNNAYSLYTEKIVKNPGNKIKRIIRHLAKVVGSGVVFGVTASLVMLLIYPNAIKFIEEDETATRQSVVLPTDSQTYDESTEDYTDGADFTSGDGQSTSEYQETDSSDSETKQEETGNVEQTSGNEGPDVGEINNMIDAKIGEALGKYKPGVAGFNSMYLGLRSVIAGVNHSIVSVMTSDDVKNWDYVSGEAYFGLIAAEDEDNLYILTLNEYVKDKFLSVCFYDGTTIPAQYLSGDATTGIAAIAVPKVETEVINAGQVRTAVLGNSYMVQQGDPLIAVGNILNRTNMVSYTYAAATKSTAMDTDSNYRLLTTDIAADSSDCGVIANTSGEIVGIIVHGKDTSNDRIITAYGISEIKSLIERLINGKVTPYVGILPQSVTTAMETFYNIPRGIYVYGIEEGSPAYYAGIQSGDVITAVGGTKVATVKEFQTALFNMEQGSSVSMSISRPGKDEYRDIEIIVEIGAE